MKFEFNETQVKELTAPIKINYIPGTKFIDANTYSVLVDKSYDLIMDKYVDLVRDSRKEQRKNMANHKVYFELIDSFMSNSESLIAEGQRKLYSNLGFDVARWE